MRVCGGCVCVRRGILPFTTWYHNFFPAKFLYLGAIIHGVFFYQYLFAETRTSCIIAISNAKYSGNKTFNELFHHQFYLKPEHHVLLQSETQNREKKKIKKKQGGNCGNNKQDKKKHLQHRGTQEEPQKNILSGTRNTKQNKHK